MKVKDSTVQTEFHPTLTYFLFKVDILYREWESELIITSGSEPTAYHSFTSLHYARPCQAADIRVWALGKVPTKKIQYKTVKKLAKEFCKEQGIPTNWLDIILESTHIHIEYQPKRHTGDLRKWQH